MIRLRSTYLNLSVTVHIQIDLTTCVRWAKVLQSKLRAVIIQILEKLRYMWTLDSCRTVWCLCKLL